MRMLLTSSFDTYTGYGNDAVDMAVQFEKMGIDVVPWPEHLAPGLPKTFTDLLTKDPGGRYDLSVAFCPPFDLIPDKFAGLGDVAVGWTMWERTPLVRADMLNHGWDNEDDREHWWSRDPLALQGADKDWLDLLQVTCPDNVDAFASLDPHAELAVCPNGIDPARYEEVERTLDDRKFRFASIGMLAGRKDPFATLQAWKLAQEMDPSFDAELILKTSTTGLHPKIADVYRNVRVINSVWNQKTVVDFYGHVDVLVSTSRGEGNNKPAMEFMSTGGPVMATDWSGHRNWLHEASGYPLPGELVPINGSSEIRDFRVDVQATAETFLHCWRNQSEVRAKGAQAARRIRAELSWEKVCDRFLKNALRVM
jgi:glycosyltransferase involved in cell wall biosynthesis